MKRRKRTEKKFACGKRALIKRTIKKESPRQNQNIGVGPRGTMLGIKRKQREGLGAEGGWKCTGVWRF